MARYQTPEFMARKLQLNVDSYPIGLTCEHERMKFIPNPSFPARSERKVLGVRCSRCGLEWNEREDGQRS